jgi:hypothetical protein
MEASVSGVIALLMIWLVVGAWRVRRGRVSVGPAAAGMMHELLNEDRRAAVEIILEERAAERDPEDRDGNLPDLEDPTRSRKSPEQVFPPVHDSVLFGGPS